DWFAVEFAGDVSDWTRPLKRSCGHIVMRIENVDDPLSVVEGGFMQRLRVVVSLLFLVFVFAESGMAQVRVKPKTSKGGPPSNQPWVDIPETFRSIPMPDWQVPTDLKKWEGSERAKTRKTLLELMGELPARPDPKTVRIIKTEEHDGYRLER